MDSSIPNPQLQSPESLPTSGISPEIPSLSSVEQAPLAPLANPGTSTTSPLPPTSRIVEPQSSAVTPTPLPPLLIADDVDVIEKEWVDRTDDIRKQTQGDPHAEEEAIETLQQQYLKQRYGRDVGKPKDE